MNVKDSKMATLHPTLAKRAVLKENGCIEYRGYCDKKGYCRFGHKRKLAHRVSYELSIGIIPDGLHVCHRCDNRCCINPNHLFLGTNEDNVRDCISKGRNAKGETITNSKLTEEHILKIRMDTRPDKVIAAEYGISQGHVSRIQMRRTWKHIP
jgi:hypothetical protein